MKNLNVNERRVLTDMREKIESEDHELLYLVRFGSHLYGTNGPNSDVDFKGVFLPSMKSCLLGNAPKHFTSTTGESGSKNSKDDIDVQLWSLQYWMSLVGKGETNALDLLYSFSNQSASVYMDDRMPNLFANHSKLFNSHDCNSYVGYAIGQARKYGIKGSRLGVMKKVMEFLDLNHLDDFCLGMCLRDVIEDLIKNCGQESYCFVKDLKGGHDEMKPYLCLCGAKHDLTISLEEFYRRVKSAHDHYGNRAKAAEESDGVDFKALSHALRALDQMSSLLMFGKIDYPLHTANHLRDVKEGKYTWAEVEPMLQDGLHQVEHFLEICTPINKLDKEFVDNAIVEFFYS